MRNGSTDLLMLAAELVAIPSVSHEEADLAAWMEETLSGPGHLEVTRVGDSVIARTALGRDRRLVLAGHLDTVPGPGGADATRPPAVFAGPDVRGDVLWGLGSVDMKGGLAVLVDLAVSVQNPDVDLTFVFYACEETDRADNALVHLAAEQPELIGGDAAILAEPTGGALEAGCQGTMRATVTVAGRTAHTARPWVGLNAIHRLAPLLARIADYDSRQVVIDGCRYAEQIQAVGIEGGIASNVVPDSASVTVNYRFAPDRSVQDAELELRRYLDLSLDAGAGDMLAVMDAAPGAPPSLGHPLLGALASAAGVATRAKLGWTDVSTFYGAGIPAANFGPGDPLLAHTPDEHVSRSELAAARATLGALVGEAC